MSGYRPTDQGSETAQPDGPNPCQRGQGGLGGPIAPAVSPQRPEEQYMSIAPSRVTDQSLVIVDVRWKASRANERFMALAQLLCGSTVAASRDIEALGETPIQPPNLESA